MRILLVEDDPLIVEGLSELLEAEGYEVVSAADQDGAIASALNPADGTAPDLVLLDLTLARGNGFAVCSAVKAARPNLPVIVLTASVDEVNTVTGLSLGADDYVAKPFRPRELVARVAAVLRRSRAAASPRITWGPLAIDPERAVVAKDGAEVALSALEYRLLLLFATNPGRLITRERMRDVLWDAAGAYVEENTLSVYVKRLRAKVERDPAHPELIVTVRGLGYRAGE